MQPLEGIPLRFKGQGFRTGNRVDPGRTKRRRCLKPTELDQGILLQEFQCRRRIKHVFQCFPSCFTDQGVVRTRGLDQGEEPLAHPGMAPYTRPPTVWVAQNHQGS